MVLSLLLTGAVPALSTASIYLYKVLVDDVLTPHDFRLFPMIAALYLGITLADGVLTWIDEVLSAWVGERFVLNLRVELFTHLQRLSLILRAPPARRRIPPRRGRQRSRHWS